MIFSPLSLSRRPSRWSCATEMKFTRSVEAEWRDPGFQFNRQRFVLFLSHVAPCSGFAARLHADRSVRQYVDRLTRAAIPHHMQRSCRRAVRQKGGPLIEQLKEKVNGDASLTRRGRFLDHHVPDRVGSAQWLVSNRRGEDRLRHARAVRDAVMVVCATGSAGGVAEILERQPPPWLERPDGADQNAAY